MRIYSNHIKIASWLTIPVLVAVGMVEHNLREASVKANRARLLQAGADKEKQAVENLVRGCSLQEKMKWLPSYLAERLFGNCRSLFQAPLNGAKLRNADLSNVDLFSADLSNVDLFSADLFSADLSNVDLFSADLSNAILSNAILSDADLYDADLSYAVLNSSDLSDANLFSVILGYTNLHDANLSYTDLRNANLRDTNLSNADLSNADLSYTVLSNADLRDTNLHNADFREPILLNTDFRTTKELTQEQLEGDHPPFICNSPLPTSVKINRNRDCDKLATILIERYLGWFAWNIDEAEKFINEKRQKQWE